MGAGRDFGQGPYSAGGHPRRGKDHHGAGLFQGPGPGVQPHPVYAGRAALGYHRLFRARPPAGGNALSARRGADQSVPGGRAEPGHLPHPVGAAGGHGGGTGHGGRREPRPAAALYRDRNPEPGGGGGHPAAARQPDGPLPHPPESGLPRPQRRGDHGAEPAGGKPPAIPAPGTVQRAAVRASGHGGEDLYQRHGGQLHRPPDRRHPGGRGDHPRGQSPGDPGGGGDGQGHCPAAGAGLCDPVGRAGGISPVRGAPADSDPPGADPGRCTGTGAPAHPGDRADAPASLIWPEEDWNTCCCSSRRQCTMWPAANGSPGSCC